MARKFFPLDIDLGGDSEQLQTLSAKDSKSKLPKAVQVTKKIHCSNQNDLIRCRSWWPWCLTLKEWRVPCWSLRLTCQRCHWASWAGSRSRRPTRSSPKRRTWSRLSQGARASSWTQATGFLPWSHMTLGCDLHPCLTTPTWSKPRSRCWITCLKSRFSNV